MKGYRSNRGRVDVVTILVVVLLVLLIVIVWRQV